MKQTYYISAILMLVVLTACASSQAASQSKIAFVSNRDGSDDIYIMDTDGGSPSRLTNDTDTEYQLAWSPDAKQILFVSAQVADDFIRESSDIYVVDADGSNLIQLTSDYVFNSSPVWSPDGTKIAFVSWLSGSNAEIFVIDAGGNNLTRLTDNGGTFTTPSGATYNGAEDRAPSWSPNGQQILFLSNRNVGHSEIYIMDAGGGNPTLLTTSSEINGGGFPQYESPAWSPDGEQIAFISDRDGYLGAWEIYVMDAGGGNLNRLTIDLGVIPLGLAWSPNGASIAFFVDSGLSNDIYSIDIIGGNLTRLTSGGVWPFGGISWSQDGAKIIYVIAGSAQMGLPENSNIYIMDADGANRINLTSAKSRNYSPSWSS